MLVLTSEMHVLLIERNKLLFAIALERPAQRILCTKNGDFVVCLDKNTSTHCSESITELQLPYCEFRDLLGSQFFS